MGYTKRFNPQRYRPIGELLEKLEGLEEGEVATLRGLDREALANARWLVYDWISHVAPGRFRVDTEAELGQLRVRKKGWKGGEVTVESAGAGGLDRELLEELILLPSQEVVEEKLREEVGEGRVSLRGAGELLEEWKRVMR